ncbi:MAG: hypothetical protein ACREEC_10050, partial [Thermoplasmata archaeon]
MAVYRLFREEVSRDFCELTHVVLDSATATLLHSEYQSDLDVGRGKSFVNEWRDVWSLKSTFHERPFYRANHYLGKSSQVG